jgi:RND superfamily putative drug exporter
MVMVPAVMALLGKAAWWFPSWLGWLPHLDLGESADAESGAGGDAESGAGGDAESGAGGDTGR